MIGSIPAVVGNFTEPVALYVTDVKLYIDMKIVYPVMQRSHILMNDRYLGSNQLTGSIPFSLGNLSNLQYLYVCWYVHDIDVMSES